MTNWGSCGWKDWGTGEHVDNNKKRPHYENSGCIKSGDKESDNMKTNIPITHQKTSQWKGWRPYEATKWAERQNGESSAKKWKARGPDEEPFDSTKSTKKPKDQADNDDEEMQNSVAETESTASADSPAREEKARRRGEHFIEWRNHRKMAGSGARAKSSGPQPPRSKTSSPPPPTWPRGSPPPKKGAEGSTSPPPPPPGRKPPPLPPLLADMPKEKGGTGQWLPRERASLTPRTRAPEVVLTTADQVNKRGDGAT